MSLRYGLRGPTVPAMHTEQQTHTLPEWPTRTIAVLTTVNGAPHAIPVSAPVRAGDRRILLSLHRDRGSLARLREDPRVALTLLAEGDVAFTARGRAHVVEEPMAVAHDYAAVAIDVEHVDDHRQAAFVVESGAGRRWVDADEQRALGARVAALRGRD
jgi:mannose-6-phosphate isomerase-like protein (cupin superfamily)